MCVRICNLYIKTSAVARDAPKVNSDYATPLRDFTATLHGLPFKTPSLEIFTPEPVHPVRHISTIANLHNLLNPPSIRVHGQHEDDIVLVGPDDGIRRALDPEHHPARLDVHDRPPRVDERKPVVLERPLDARPGRDGLLVAGEREVRDAGADVVLAVRRPESQRRGWGREGLREEGDEGLGRLQQDCSRGRHCGTQACLLCLAE